jgi:23S rRNA (adenine2503-C2)-methyltransferase
MTNKKPLIYDFTKDELSDILAEWGEPKFRSSQIWQGLYKHLYSNPSEFTNLSKKLSSKLTEYFSFSNLSEKTTLKSSDNHTEKSLLALPSENYIETVLMKYKKRRTLCISTQSGCAMGCVFCATGQMGLIGNLSTGEIVEQVLFFARRLRPIGESITNIVYMGMGEPFHNYENTMKSIEILNDHSGINLGARRITVSTVGLIPQIKKFTLEKRQINLAISLHSSSDEKRSEMIPVNKKHSIEKLIEACKEYIEITGRRITFEWALIDGENDSQKEAHALGKLLKDLNCHVNLIQLNPTTGFSGSGSSKLKADQFIATLAQYHIPATIRIRRGIDINAGCGQLASSTK